MYSNLLNQIENAFHEGFSDNSFRKLGKGYVGPLEIKDEEDFYLIKKVIAVSYTHLTLPTNRKV